MSDITVRLKDFATIEENVSFTRLTTYKAGGTARYVIYPNDSFGLQNVLSCCKENGIPVRLLGNGSNILVSDDYYDGAIIKLNRFFNQVYYDDTTVVVQGGTSIITLAYECARKGLSGLEFAAGIPGTIGGCIYMNAGAYKASIGDFVEAVQIIDDGEIRWIDKENCEFGYRSSIFQKHPDWIIIAARLKLSKGEEDQIISIMKERQERRFATQPLDKPCAGSVFRNPENGFAWQLIDGIGYRGKCKGDACVSEKHSNFIINNGNATAEEINDLIEEIQEKVYEKYGVKLILEVEKINWNH